MVGQSQCQKLMHVVAVVEVVTIMGVAVETMAVVENIEVEVLN